MQQQHVEGRGPPGAGAPHRRRAMSVEVMRRREAKVLVLAVNRRIGSWQAQAARLIVCGQRLRAAGALEPALRDEAIALRAAIERQRDTFERQLEVVPRELGSSGHVADTRRALAMLIERADHAVALLGRPSPDHGATDA
jgi:hypothetical protein